MYIIEYDSYIIPIDIHKNDSNNSGYKGIQIKRTDQVVSSVVKEERSHRLKRVAAKRGKQAKGIVDDGIVEMKKAGQIGARGKQRKLELF